MALYATRVTHCRGQIFQAGDEITSIRMASDERLMRTVYGAAEAPPAPPAPTAPTAPKAPRRRYNTRRLKAQD